MRKYLWVCFLLAIVFYCIAEQSGAIQSIKDNFASGKSQAIVRGWSK